ncbi:MAG: nucleotidyltransferase family protein [Verrucomicrobiia bacterium]|jgi:NDP-sugar pyrophosphorylase family protein
MPDRLGNIPAVILVGGLGTRLRSLLPDHQKVVAPVAGRPFVFRLLDQLAEAGLQRVILCTGYKAEQVAELVGASYRGLGITYSPEPAPLGTAGALRQALSVINSDTVLVMNGDSYCEVNLSALFESHRRSGANATLVVIEVPKTRDGGRVTFDNTGAITSFVEKGTARAAGWMSAGIYMLQRAVLEGIPSGRAVSIEREVFPAWIGRGLHAFRTAGKFLDIGTPESYAVAQQVLP